MTAERKVRLISAARHMYGGRLIVPNEVFEANERDADDLIALHFAVRDESEPKPRRTYRRRDMKAED